jgi:mycoredoxin
MSPLLLKIHVKESDSAYPALLASWTELCASCAGEIIPDHAECPVHIGHRRGQTSYAVDAEYLCLKLDSPAASVKWTFAKICTRTNFDIFGHTGTVLPKTCQNVANMLAWMCGAADAENPCLECSGLRGLKMSKPSKQIIVYGASWCPDARRARRVFDEHRVDYRWIDIDEDSSARDFVKKTNDGQIIIPVIVFPDESILVEPSNHELAEKMEVLSGGELSQA